MRKEYLAGELNENQCPENPYSLFKEWFDLAVAEEKFEPNAFALSTVGHSGQPHSRIVLLKYAEENKFVFVTNYESQKAKDLLENPNACMLFFWQKLERQIRIEGKIFKVSREESKEIFSKRPRGSQIGALASRQSSEIPDRKSIEKRYQELTELNQNFECPENWGGYYLLPEYYEFWQGRENRLHDRIVYQLDGQWNRKRLSP